MVSRAIACESLPERAGLAGTVDTWDLYKMRPVYIGGVRVPSEEDFSTVLSEGKHWMQARSPLNYLAGLPKETMGAPEVVLP